ncbi:hypothetical protein HUN08_17750 [Gordonia sp. X0973]|uniref:hypothetical protein n=1 Tax=Gordonia sp. X0973 TaxID=2742602 RepID=UPI00101CECFE|nr:hypothetical protein [Gordonia sp. X0973]QKT08846.1 hypothetical protein HUN08_17750 [Gordonia sp. X0973]
MTVTMGPEPDIRGLTHPLTVLNGKDENHLILTRLVRPAWPDELSEAEEDESNETFLQAGGSAEAMTLEMRVESEGGGYTQFIVGRPVSGDQHDAEMVSIAVGKYRYDVLPNEVFNAKQAGDVMIYYFEHDTVPSGYSLRELIRSV